MHCRGSNTHQAILVLGLNLVLAICFASAGFAQQCDPAAATAASVQGVVEVQVVGSTDWRAMQRHDAYCPGDTIRVGENSRASLSLANGSVLRLRAGSTLTLEEMRAKRTSLISLLKGAAHFFSRRPNSLEVRTAHTVAGVRGTEFYINVTDDQTALHIFTGEVVAKNEHGSLSLTGGHSAVAELGKAPALRVTARPRDAVQWALYYPPALYAQPDPLNAGVDWERQVGAAMEAHLRGDLRRAFDAIASVSDDIREPGFFTYRAALHLAVGQTDEAHADIERALQRNADDSDALALQTMIAVVRNDKDKALETAQRAVQADANSATAQIAMSYVQQSRFDLEGARKSLETAVQAEPANALAWARLAELHASFGDLGKSLKAAKRAASLEPNLARTQTVLGFAYLTRVETDNAKMAFDKAADLDQADPLPHLGMGLAIIRDGNVTAGVRELEVAASLDPNNSLIRSYLGKAYYEEKRGALDEREFDMAKQLDPNDPTPWFYSAIAKQTTNRPVEALRDMQKAIERNDNRAVYRSKLLLDSDLAARSASQARIYSDLGFQQLALVEGWKSVNTDPTNYSAHRFLADSYAVLPRHEIARVSELLQAQLLQPLNMTPIQPRLAESNLFLMSAGGPSALSFNEFSPLFNRNGVTAQASGLAGEHDAFAGEGVLAGIAGIGSYSIGYSHFETDGFRSNNDQEDDILNIFIQTELTHQTSFQTEFRYRDRNNGDLELRFFENDFSPFLREETKNTGLRLGLRHAFSPRSILLASYIYQYKNINFHDATPNFGINAFDLDRDETSHSGEAQYLFRSRSLDWFGGLIGNINITMGGGHFFVDSDEMTAIEIDLPPPPFGPGPITDTFETNPDVTHTNLYLYSHLSLGKHLTLTLGASGDFFDEDDGVGKSDEANPKFGLVWKPFPGTTLRAAAFKVLKRTLVTDQTLEPTQVAGFNQFFDDPSATEAWRYGGAIDQKLTHSLFAGVEFSKRDLKVPFNVLASTGELIVQKFNWDEYLGRAYLFWTPHAWLALSTEYQYERFKRDPEFPFAFEEVTTHRAPVAAQFFHPSGFSALLRATYLNQDGDFELREPPFGFQSDSRDFWILDTAIRYRLPKRYGLVTVGVNNLLDEDSTYQATDLRNPTIRPGRAVFARVTLTLP